MAGEAARILKYMTHMPSNDKHISWQQPRYALLCARRRSLTREASG